MGKKKNGKKAKPDKKKEFDHLPAGELATAVTQAARSLRTALGRSLADIGLYAGQDGVILALAEEDGLTAGQLAARLGVKAPTMTRTVGRMEVQGFLTRQDDQGDGRLTKVFLTDQGRSTVEQIERSVAGCCALAAEDFTEKEVRSLLRLLNAMDRNLQQPSPGSP